MEQKEAPAGAGEAAAQAAALEDEKASRDLEQKINRRLFKIQRDQDEMLKIQMRIQRYRQEVHRLSLKRAEKMTFRLL